MSIFVVLPVYKYLCTPQMITAASKNYNIPIVDGDFMVSNFLSAHFLPLIHILKGRAYPTASFLTDSNMFDALTIF